MSYTEIMKFDRNGNAISAGVIKNASRGAWFVWNVLSQKYLGRDFSYLDTKLEQETWDLFRDSRLADTERIVLGSTYDFVLIKKENLQTVIDAYEEFSNLYKSLNLNESLSEQAEILKLLKEDADCMAIGFHQNSVSCDMWLGYNCLSGTEHWYLFDEMRFFEKQLEETEIGN